MGSSSSPVVNVYPLANYTFGTKEPKMEKDTSVDDRLARMKVNYMKEGMRTSVEAILLVQEHNHPHVLLLQIGNTFYKLPGGRLKPGENEIEGLKRKLCSKLAVNSPSFPPNWQVGECVAVWWRPNFETVMYPYCPPHNTEPKECKKLFIVHLSEREYFAVPRNLKLLAVPLFELYNNVQQYEPVISAIPQQLSRFQFNMESSLMELKKELQERSTQKLVDDLKKKVQILQVKLSEKTSLLEEAEERIGELTSKVEEQQKLILKLEDDMLKGYSSTDRRGSLLNDRDLQEISSSEASEDSSRETHEYSMKKKATKKAAVTIWRAGGGRGQRSVRQSRHCGQANRSLSPSPVNAARVKWSEAHTVLLYEYCVKQIESSNVEELSEDSYKLITQKLCDKGVPCNIKSVKEKMRATKRFYNFWKNQVVNSSAVNKNEKWWGKVLKKRKSRQYQNLKYGPPKHLKLIERIFGPRENMKVPDLSMAVSATRATPAKKRPQVDEAQKPREEITMLQEQLTGSEKDKIDDIDVERVKQLMSAYDLALAAARENPTEFMREAREARLRLTAAVLQPD